MCEWEDFSARAGFARARLRDGVSLSPFLLLSEPGITAAEQRESADNWMRARIALAAEGRASLARQTVRPHGARIRLGYLSSDFQDHATALLLIETLEAHDRGAFELFAYSSGAADTGDMRRRVEATFDCFRAIGPMTDQQAGQAIHDDGIDILIDLKGFTQDSRTSILALRPAPVQVNYLGYPGTLGVDLCDYLITDAFVTPHACADDYAESFAFLPHSYQPRGRRAVIGAAPTRAEAGLPEDAFVFCCFNQAYKFTPEVFGLWRQCLNNTPGSVLWLLAAPEAEGNLRNEAWNHGVAGDRLIFAPDAAQDRHLQRLQLADLVLDTSPYGAHTTASDALWAGVPVVTRPGGTFASRVAGSVLRAVGLPELIVDSDDAYVALALALAHDRARLAKLRQKLADARATAPLFDVAAYTLALEDLYMQMTARQRANLPPMQIAARGKFDAIPRHTSANPSPLVVMPPPLT
jgi:predicted O-linked N-acetylglucosamine transferase (SPINDLY family)